MKFFTLWERVDILFSFFRIILFSFFDKIIDLCFMVKGVEARKKIRYKLSKNVREIEKSSNKEIFKS